jgi:phosphatidylinositol-3,4,5-trisphosphate 3-phosphatase/dual-specificity protein phosphatase PTEN
MRKGKAGLYKVRGGVARSQSPATNPLVSGDEANKSIEEPIEDAEKNETQETLDANELPMEVAEMSEKQESLDANEPPMEVVEKSEKVKSLGATGIGVMGGMLAGAVVGGPIGAVVGAASVAYAANTTKIQNKAHYKGTFNSVSLVLSRVGFAEFLKQESIRDDLRSDSCASDLDQMPLSAEQQNRVGQLFHNLDVSAAGVVSIERMGGLDSSRRRSIEQYGKKEGGHWIFHLKEWQAYFEHVQQDRGAASLNEILLELEQILAKGSKAAEETQEAAGGGGAASEGEGGHKDESMSNKLAHMVGAAKDTALAIDKELHLTENAATGGTWVSEAVARAVKGGCGAANIHEEGKEEYEEYRLLVRESVSLGAALTRNAKNGRKEVTRLVTGSLAQHSGEVQVGDVLLQINSVEVDGLPEGGTEDALRAAQRPMTLHFTRRFRLRAPLLSWLEEAGLNTEGLEAEPLELLEVMVQQVKKEQQEKRHGGNPPSPRTGMLDFYEPDAIGAEGEVEYPQGLDRERRIEAMMQVDDEVEKPADHVPAVSFVALVALLTALGVMGYAASAGHEIIGAPIDHLLIACISTISLGVMLSVAHSWSRLCQNSHTTLVMLLIFGWLIVSIPLAAYASATGHEVLGWASLVVLIVGVVATAILLACNSHARRGREVPTARRMSNLQSMLQSQMKLGTMPALLITGPSGVGKTTLIQKLLADWPRAFGFSHGISTSSVKKVMDAGRICILDVDIAGAQSVEASSLQPQSIFVEPPSLEVLEERLRTRGDNSDEEVNAHLKRAPTDIAYGQSGSFDASIVNDDLNRAYDRLVHVLLEWYPSLIAELDSELDSELDPELDSAELKGVDAFIDDCTSDESTDDEDDGADLNSRKIRSLEGMVASTSRLQARKMSTARKIIKTLVSKKKRRFKADGFDLDLSYINERVIAMGYPADSIEAVYRNSYEDVYRFFENRHPGAYKFYNLCSERNYDPNIFHGRVARYPHDDHNPPLLALFKPYCEDLKKWFDADPRNVAAIHCKAGKGRTGTMIVAWLVYNKDWLTVEDAMKFYAAARTKNQKGITIPSQRRYVTYFAELCNKPGVEMGELPAPAPMCMRAIRFHGIPKVALKGSFEPSFRVRCGKITYECKSPAGADRQDGGRITLDCPDYILCDDVHVTMCNKGKKMFEFWFHTSFVQNFNLQLRKSVLDKAYKDAKKGHKKYPQDFKVEVMFVKLPEDLAAENRRASIVGLDKFQQFQLVNGDDVTATFGTRDLDRLMSYYKDTTAKKEQKATDKKRAAKKQVTLAEMAGERRRGVLHHNGTSFMQDAAASRNSDREQEGGEERETPGEGSCVLGGDVQGNVILAKHLRLKSTAAHLMLAQSQEMGEMVLHLNKLSCYGHMLIFTIAILPSLGYAFVFSRMCFGAEFFVYVTQHEEFATHFYGFAACLLLVLYILDFGMWTGYWKKVKHVCICLCTLAIIGGAVISAADEPSYPMAMFMFSNVGFFILAKQHHAVKDVKNKVRPRSRHSMPSILLKPRSFHPSPLQAFLLSLGSSLLLNCALLLAVWLAWIQTGVDFFGRSWESNGNSWGAQHYPLSKEIKCHDDLGQVDHESCQAAYLMWAAPLLASGTSGVLGISALIFSRQLQNGKLKPLRAFATLILCAFILMWVAASFAAVGMNLSNVVVIFSAVALVGAAVTIWGTVGLHSLSKQLTEVAIVEGFLAHKESFTSSDWLRSIMLMMFAPFLPLFLLLSCVNQLCRRFFDWIGRACKLSIASLPTKALGAHDRRLWLTAYWQNQLDSVAGWPWASVLSKVVYWGGGFLLLVVGVGKVTTVFLSWLNEALASLSLVAVVLIFMATGLTMFLCPVIPGIPVYITAGLVVTRRAMDDYDFWTGVAIATCTAWSIKMLSVIVQHKVFGERLSTYVYVRSVVAVNSVQTRAMSKILAVPGFTWAKMVILVGGPDWPTTTLTGVLGLPLCQVFIGSLPGPPSYFCDFSTRLYIHPTIPLIVAISGTNHLATHRLQCRCPPPCAARSRHRS